MRANVAPMTTGGQPYPFRVPCQFGGKAGRLALDQLRTVDRERLRRRLGALAAAELGAALTALQEMFEG
ncbi:MAG TPA: type II toxin-antitoxin system PemK/MazF family toxin [Gemmatimonadaceae bacterium]|nr:type II toxin-antitoxin system PemK/MazF family toxin [Gemmatimonadaceae bacterium]